MKKTEIEYRYILKSMPDIKDTIECIQIKQFYIHRDNNSSTRIRSINNNEFILTHKEGKGRKRNEEELYIDASIFELLKKISFGAVYKNRYIYVIHGSPFIWSLDIYKNTLQGLILLEAELNINEEDKGKPEIPSIFKTHIAAEVTQDQRYTNLFLSLLHDKTELNNSLSTWGITS